MPSHNQGYEVIIDGVSSTTIPEFICHHVVRQLAGNRRHRVQEVAGVEGGWLFPEQPGMRKITLDCGILADSFPLERRGAVREVAAWADKLEWTKVVIGDDPDWFNMAILEETPDIEEWRERGEFDLVFLTQPYALSNDIQSLDQVNGDADLTFNVNVGGDARTYPIITLTPTATATSATITINGRTLTYAASVTNAGKLTYNGIARIFHTGVNVDTDVIGDFSGATLSMGSVTVFEVPWFEPGDNSVTINMPSAAGWTANIRWRNRTR